MLNVQLTHDYYLGIRPDVQTHDRVRDFCDIAEGWQDIIERLLTDLDKPEMEWDHTIMQVKEKFGGLRFYIGAGSSQVYDRIHQAELESVRTCMTCGKPGRLSRTSWIECACDEHMPEEPANDPSTI